MGLRSRFFLCSLLLSGGCGPTEDPADAAAGDAGVADASDPRDGAGVDAAVEIWDPRDPVEPIEIVDPADFMLPTWPSDAMGDLLISESGRGCLSVSPDDGLFVGARVEVGACRGLTGQRWSESGGTVRPADAPDLCIDGDGAWGSPVTLASCAGLTEVFALATDGVFERGGVALDVTSDLSLVIYGTHRGDNQRWRWLGDDLTFLEMNAGHVVSYPFAHDDTLSFEVEEARHRVGSVQPPYPHRAPRDVSGFPGDVSTSAAMASRRVHLDRRFDHDTSHLRVAWPPQHWQSTGLYAPAGRVVVVVVPVGTDPDGLAVRVNVHTDVLRPTSSNVVDGTFDRMPRLSIRVPLEVGPNAIRSPYGGTIILESTVAMSDTVPVEIHGAVAMPRFLRGVTTQAQWDARRALGAPWAELESRRAVITVASETVRDLTRPEEVIARYDRAVELEMDLFALDDTSPAHRPYSGKARFVEDLQITAGWGHSGFPIMTQLGWNLAHQDTGGEDWGVWHELGHNHQQFCLWSTRFGSESTVNLFSLYVQEVEHSENRIAEQYAPTIAAVSAGMTFDDADVWQKLVFLMQPVHALADGWEIYRRVHRAYRELPESEAMRICASEEAQVDTFYRLLSIASGHDLRDHFAAWGVFVSAPALDAVAAMSLPAPPVPVHEATP